MEIFSTQMKIFEQLQQNLKINVKLVDLGHEKEFFNDTWRTGWKRGRGWLICTTAGTTAVLFWRILFWNMLFWHVTPDCTYVDAFNRYCVCVGRKCTWFFLKYKRYFSLFRDVIVPTEGYYANIDSIQTSRPQSGNIYSKISAKYAPKGPKLSFEGFGSQRLCGIMKSGKIPKFGKFGALCPSTTQRNWSKVCPEGVRPYSRMLPITRFIE